MSTYIIGDVHGCYDELRQLLRRIDFDRRHDRLIFVGDLINRGPKSLEVLRFIRSLGDAAQLVLGNHDISFIAYAVGAYQGKGSDFPQMLEAQDAPELLQWLRQQPLLIQDDSLNAVIVHAGLPPRWSLKKAIKQAKKAEKQLQGEDYEKFLHHAYQKKQASWSSELDKYSKFRYRIDAFTRLRYCDKNGEPDYREKCPIGSQRIGLYPWFERRAYLQDDGGVRLIFGHWAALGYYVDPRVICLDSGCVWGGQLSAIKLHESTVFRAFVEAFSHVE